MRRALSDLHATTKNVANGLYVCYNGLGGHDAEMDELDVSAYRRTLGDENPRLENGVRGLSHCYNGLGGHDAEMVELRWVHQL